MADKDIRAFLPLHSMEFRILVMLWQGTPSFTAQLVQNIERRKGSRRSPYPKSLMNTVRDLLDHRLLEPCGDPAKKGAHKEWFKISQLGEKVLLAEVERIQALVGEATEMGII